MRNLRRQLRFVGELPYAVELRLERRQPPRVDSFLVHASRVVIPNLASHAVAAGLGLRRSVQNRAQGLLVALIQFLESPPARLIGGNGIAGQPVTAGVLVEI